MISPSLNLSKQPSQKHEYSIISEFIFSPVNLTKAEKMEINNDLRILFKLYYELSNFSFYVFRKDLIND
jgi:hypothetical protein